MNKESLKIKRIIVDRRFLTEMIEALSNTLPYRLKILNPLPTDANIIATYFDPSFNAINLIVQSKEFEEVRECSEVPMYYFTLQHTEKKVKNYVRKT